MVENQPSNLLQLYQHKLEKCQINFDKLVEGFDSLNSQLKERIAQELMVEKAEEKVCSLSDTLGRTQSLLLIERKNSQEMALHIDLLLEQHKADVKRLDLILALDGKTVRNEGRTELSLLRTHVKKLENVLREQAASLLEERSLLKVEWEKERQSSDKSKREMKSKLQILKNQVIQLNQHAAKYHRNSIEHFLRGNYLEVDADIDDDTSHQASGPNNNQFTLKTHCLDQETKKLKRQCETLQKEVLSYQKKCVSQTTVVKELREELLKTREKHKVQMKAMREQSENLRKETNQLNKRRLNEGAGYRSEISLLRDELQRTQKQLCFLTIRKLDE